MKKPTNQELIIENEKLKTEIERLSAVDQTRRKELSELLDSYEWTKEYYGGHQEKKTIIQSWLGIAFLIGELKGDANLSVTIQAREDLKRQNQELHQRIYELENPKKD